MSDINTGEIWTEILKRLPVKTLGQCRCVCKPWNNLIVSPPFKTAHLKNYTQNNANSLLMYRQFSTTPEIQEQYTVFFNSVKENGGDKLEVRDTFTCPFIATKIGYHFRVVGSVNGLICLSDDLCSYTYLILLWNPIIHKYIQLPIPLATYHVTVGAYICMLGFGYDSKKDDHKVVRLVYLRGKDHLDITPPKVELYSVQEEKWRWVSGDSLVNICVCDKWWSQCFLNGYIHWVSWERDGNTLTFQRNCLLLFDVVLERFKKMKLPEPLSKVNTINLSVSEFEGKLSILYSKLKGGFLGNEMESCEIWVKKEYNVGTSWCQMVKIECSTSGLGWIQCLRKSGEVLGFTKRGKLVSYNPSREEYKRLGFHGRWRSWATCSFTESLILLDKKNGVGTYKEAGGRMKKRFNHNIDSATFAQTLVEEEVEVDEGDLEDPINNTYFQGGFILIEQLMKFEAGNTTGDLAEFMSSLGFP